MSRSPRCGERNAARRRRCRTCSSARRRRRAAAVRQRPAAAARPGRSPRERRRGNSARTTESSQRRWIGRSWPRNASAIPDSRSRASVVSERDRLVGAVAARQDDRPAECVEQQMVERRVGEHQPEPRRARRRPTVRSRRRSARARARSGARATRGAAAHPASSSASASGRLVITANGLSSRCLRDRSRDTASSSPASQARW